MGMGTTEAVSWGYEIISSQQCRTHEPGVGNRLYFLSTYYYYYYYYYCYHHHSQGFFFPFQEFKDLEIVTLNLYDLPALKSCLSKDMR